VVPPNLYFTPLNFSAFLTILSAFEAFFLLFVPAILDDEQELKITAKIIDKNSAFFIDKLCF